MACHTLSPDGGYAPNNRGSHHLFHFIRYIFLISTMIVVLFSCSKENNYPKTFSRFEFSSGTVKMYTKTGIVTEEQKINEFTERIRQFFLNSENGPGGSVYSFNDDINEFENYDLEIILFSETKGELKIKSDDSNDVETISFHLVKKEDYYVISIHDTIAYKESYIRFHHEKK